MDAILGSIYSLLITLVGAIYNLVATVFELFSMLSKVTTIDKNVYGNIIENFYLLIGVVMLFIIAFYLLKAMINPDDNKETSSGGKIVKNFITSVIILLILPTIFNFAFSFQFAIVDYNTIGRMFGYNNSADTMASAGNSMANSVFTAFFTPSREQCPTGDFDECAKDITSGEDKLSTVISNVNKTGYFTSYSKFGDNVAKNEIDFNFLIALIAGLYLVYVIFSFCLDLGVRLVKLVFYQIIAPIPVFLRVVPEGKLSNTFNDWVKITITCYLEVFIRLFIIFFGVYLISAFTSNEGLGSFLNVGSGFLGLMAKVIIILGVITFIKQAPKLIGDIFGFDSSNMKLGLREKLAAGGLFAAGGAVGSLIASKGNPLAAVRGWKNGIGNIGAEAKRRKEYKDARSAGVTKRQMMKDYMLNKAGFGSQADIQKSKIEDEDYNVSNESAENITYTKPNGEKVTIGKGQNKNINAGDIESMEATKAENVNKISAHRDRIKNLEQEAASGSSRIQHKKNLKDEAEKKIDEAGSKVIGTLEYEDENGNSMTFKGTYEQIMYFKQNNLSVEQRQKVDSDEKIRDRMIADYIANEYSLEDSKIKQDMNSGFRSIQNNGGYEYNTFVYEFNPDGSYKTDANGNKIIAKDSNGKEKTTKIKFNVKLENGNWIIDEDSFVDENGNKMSSQQVQDTGLNGLENYDLVSKIDKLAKTSNGIINAKKQDIQENEIDVIQAQNDAIDAIKQQFNDAKDAAMRTSEMRQREISSKYIANRNNNNK